MGEATSGPFVDAISRHWSQLGREAGGPLGWAQGYNYGIKAVYIEAKGRPQDTLEGIEALIPKGLYLPASADRPNKFCTVKGNDPKENPPQPCLEQIWFDIGFEMARSEEYVRGIPAGAEAAYRSLRESTRNDDAKRVPPPPKEPRSPQEQNG
jgi:hypothetical protein